MDGLSSAPTAPLFELYFTSNKLFVLAGPVISALALPAYEFYESVL